MGGCAHKSPTMKWADGLKTVFKKNSLKLNTASHKNTSWYTDANGFLKHSISGGSLYYKGPTLQRTIPVFGGSPFSIFSRSDKNMYNFDSFVQDTYFTSAVVIFLFDGLREKQFMPLMKQVLRI